jgi:hypothetical protein
LLKFHSGQEAGGKYLVENATVSSENVESKTRTHLTYQREDDQVYVLKDADGLPLLLQKNRAMPDSFSPSRPRSLSGAFRLLALAVLGLAPAGLGSLVFAPLAMLWTLYICLTHPMDRSDRIRAAIIMGISAGLLGLAIPLSLFLLGKIT